MKAGFALAALLLDDRALALVAPALPPALLPALRAELARTRGEAGGVAALLRTLQPELRREDLDQLPPRGRPLLARLLPPTARKALLAEARSNHGSAAPRAARTDFVVDELLLRVLARLARRRATEVSP